MRDRGDTRSPTVGVDDDVDWDGSPETVSGAGGAPSAAPRTAGRIAEALVGPRRLVYGSSLFVDAEGHPLGPYRGEPLAPGWRRMRYWKGWPVPQPTLFFDARLFADKGALDESLRYALDYE